MMFIETLIVKVIAFGVIGFIANLAVKQYRKNKSKSSKR